MAEGSLEENYTRQGHCSIPGLAVITVVIASERVIVVSERNPGVSKEAS
jgi:hypothetical protein